MQGKTMQKKNVRSRFRSRPRPRPMQNNPSVDGLELQSLHSSVMPGVEYLVTETARKSQGEKRFHLIEKLFSHDFITSGPSWVPMVNNGSDIVSAVSPTAMEIEIEPEANSSRPTENLKTSRKTLATCEIDAAEDEDIVYTQILLDSPDPKSDDSTEDPGYDAELVKRLEGRDVDLTCLTTNQLKSVFRFLNDAAVCNILTSVCNMPAMDQSRYISVVATQFLTLQFASDPSLGMSRQLSTAVGPFVEKFPELSCTQLLAPLIVNAPQHHPHTNTIVCELISDRIKLAEHRTLLLRNVVVALGTLMEAHSSLLVALASSEDEENMQRLVPLMTRAAAGLAKDCSFGRLLVAVIQVLPAGSALVSQVKSIAVGHQSVLGKKALNLLKKLHAENS